MGNSSRVSSPSATPRFQPRDRGHAAAEGTEALDLALDGPLVVLEGGEALLDHGLGALERITEQVVVEAVARVGPARRGVGRLGGVQPAGADPGRAGGTRR